LRVSLIRCSQLRVITGHGGEYWRLVWRENDRAGTLVLGNIDNLYETAGPVKLEPGHDGIALSARSRLRGCMRRPALR
jgi:hypothetical protein